MALPGWPRVGGDPARAGHPVGRRAGLAGTGASFRDRPRHDRGVYMLAKLQTALIHPDAGTFETELKHPPATHPREWPYRSGRPPKARMRTCK
jgi:hypothetical protein